MEKKKEYLSEENYQNTKQKMTKVSLIILILGLVIGSCLIVGGIISQSNVKKTNEERYNEAVKLVQAKKNNDNVRLEEIETEKKNLSDLIQNKKYSCASLNMSDPNWYADKVKCNGEVSSLETELSELKMEEFELENAIYPVYYDKVLSIKYVIFYILGGIVIFASASIAGSIYFITKRREITAFAVQQTMPLAQEGIEKMAPTIGNAVGTIGKEIAKGIKEGINEADKNK